MCIQWSAFAINKAAAKMLLVTVIGNRLSRIWNASVKRSVKKLLAFFISTLSYRHHQNGS